MNEYIEKSVSGVPKFRDESLSLRGNFILIDDETFDAGNTVRHAADLRSIGDKKVSTLKDLIQYRNPKAKVTSVSADLFNIPDDDLENYLKDADLVLDMTASRQVEYFLHHNVFGQKGLPVLQAASSQATPRLVNCFKRVSLLPIHLLPYCSVGSLIVLTCKVRISDVLELLV